MIARVCVLVSLSLCLYGFACLYGSAYGCLYCSVCLNVCVCLASRMTNPPRSEWSTGCPAGVSYVILLQLLLPSDVLASLQRAATAAAAAAVAYRVATHKRWPALTAISSCTSRRRRKRLPPSAAARMRQPLRLPLRLPLRMRLPLRLRLRRLLQLRFDIKASLPKCYYYYYYYYYYYIVPDHA